MVGVFENYLVTRNVRGKVQVVRMTCEKEGKVYEILRYTGQLGGKMSAQPVIEITEGKAKRTPIQQAELEYNSKLKKYLDKGYVKIEDLTDTIFTELSNIEIEELVESDKSDQSGIPKPMLAVSSDKCSSNVFEKEWYCSRKLDGVRCTLYYKDGEILSASRGGGEYNIPTSNIRNNETLIKWFEENPTLMLDGELYSHGIPLQRLSGVARLKEWEDRCEVLEYWIYDIYSQENFDARYIRLMELQELLQDENKIKVIDHYLSSGYMKIKSLHDQFVKEGYEGLIMRNPNKPYGIGKRSSILMIKLKSYQDAEFKITGWEPGLRPVEDMCFTLETKEGKPFKAKPMGTREARQEYVDNIDDLIGLIATVKFFDYSEDKIPVQTIFKSIRYVGE